MPFGKTGRLLVTLAVGAIGLLTWQTMGKPSIAKPLARPVQGATAQIGKPFQNFTLTNIASDKKEKVSLSAYKGKQVVVGVFMANQCGTTWRYEAKIGQLIKDYSKKGVAVLAIHSNYNETDQEIVGQMESRNLAIPVLDDKRKQALARYVDAKVTPTFFIIDKAGVLQYVGSFDDRGTAPSYVPDALNAVLAGKPVTKSQTRAFG